MPALLEAVRRGVMLAGGLPMDLRWCSRSRPPERGAARREITLCVSDEEMARRAAAAPVTPPAAERGYRKFFLQSVTQADQGADFDFLMPPPTGVRVPRG